MTSAPGRGEGRHNVKQHVNRRGETVTSVLKHSIDRGGRGDVTLGIEGVGHRGKGTSLLM